MNGKTGPTAPAPKPRKWLRRLLKVFAGLVVLLVVLYFVVTSGLFLRQVILPLASKSLGVQITAGDASISPFSRIELHNVKIQSSGPDPLLTVDDVRLVYHLRDILSGNIHVDEVTVDSPVIQIITNPDGTSNLDPLLKSSGPSKPKPSKPSPPPRLDIASVALKNATIRNTKLYTGGGRDSSVVSNVNITLANLQNGQTAKVTLAAAVAVDNHPPAPGTNASLQAAMSGNFTVALADDLMPAAVTGGAKLDVPKAGGSLADLSGMAASLDCDVTATNIKQLSLQFQQAGANIGEVRLSGPLDLQKLEGRLTLEVPSIDRRVLALAAAGSGLDFGPANLSSSNVINIASGGKSVTVDGQFNAVSLALSQNGRAVPTLDFHARYGVSYDGAGGALLLRTLAINGLQNQRPLLRVDLTSPMQISLGNPGLSGSSELTLAVTNFILAEWRPFLGESADGSVALDLDLVSNPQGQHLQLGVNGRAGGFVFDHFQTTWDVNATFTNHLLHVAKASGSVRQAANAGGTLDFTADYDLARNVGQFGLKISGLNESALRPFLDPALGGQKLVSVSIDADASAAIGAGGDSSVKGRFNLANLVVNDPEKQTNSPALSVGFQVDAARSNQIVDLRQLQISLAPTARANNEITLSGRVDLTHSNVCQGTLNLTAQAIDLTSYYDLFAGKPATNKTKAASTTTAVAPANPAPSSPATEPAAFALPFRDFTFNGDIRHLYLHEIEITNFQLTTKLDGAKVALKPFGLSLNGAPVNATADVDLSVPGYKYQVTFNAQKVPIAPLADTFSPDYRGRAKGDLIATAEISGAGITDPSLKKNLSGKVDLSLTNAAVDLSVGKTPQFFMKYLINPIFIALRLPDVSHAILAQAALDAKVGAGTVDVSQFRVMASEFIVRSQGSLTLSDVMTNSTINDLPVILSLPVASAKKAGLAPSNLDPNAIYVDMGKLATVAGTFGDPKPKIDYAGIGLLTSKVVVGKADQIGGALGGDTGKVLKDVKAITGVLGGGSTNASTNDTSTNKSRLNPANLFRSVLPK